MSWVHKKITKRNSKFRKITERILERSNSIKLRVKVTIVECNTLVKQFQLLKISNWQSGESSFKGAHFVPAASQRTHCHSYTKKDPGRVQCLSVNSCILKKLYRQYAMDQLGTLTHVTKRKFAYRFSTSPMAVSLQGFWRLQGSLRDSKTPSELVFVIVVVRELARDRNKVYVFERLSIRYFLDTRKSERSIKYIVLSKLCLDPVTEFINEIAPRRSNSQFGLCIGAWNFVPIGPNWLISELVTKYWHRNTKYPPKKRKPSD